MLRNQFLLQTKDVTRVLVRPDTNLQIPCNKHIILNLFITCSEGILRGNIIPLASVQWFSQVCSNLLWTNSTERANVSGDILKNT